MAAGDLERYRRALGLDAAGAALTGLARAIAADPGWRQRAPGARLVARLAPEPRLAAILPQPGAEGWLAAQAAALPAACRHLRYLDPSAVDAACRRLAQRLRRRLGSAALGAARFVAVPRGGLLVLGHLAYRLGLEPGRLEPGAAGSPAGDEALLVAVDDCAVSGVRCRQLLARHPDRRLVFAHLLSPPPLRAAIEAAEPRVAACVAAGDLEELPGPSPDRTRLAAGDRLAGERYWAGVTRPLGFPWGEPDRRVWQAESGGWITAWRIVPPELCLKNRVARQAVPVRLLGAGTGPLRPAPGVLWERLGERLLVADLDAGATFGLAGTAADLWQALAEHGDPALAAGRLAERYAAPATELRRDAAAFAGELTGRGLLVAV